MTAESPLSRSGLLAVLGAVGLAAFLATLVRSDDPDMFHHLALGREILRAGLPAEEPFLYPLRGEVTGPAPYWLGSLAIYAARAAFGEAGLSLLPAAIGAFLALALLLDAAPRTGRHTLLTLAAAALPVALAIATYRYRAVARTEIFSALLLAVTMWGIRRFEDGRPGLLLAFPALALVWTNLHPATAVALVPLALLVLTGGISRLAGRVAGRVPERALPARPLWIALGVLLLGAGASAITPSPANPVLEALRFAAAALGLGGEWATRGDTALASVLVAAGELRGGGMALWGTPVGALLVLGALSFALRPRAIRLRELLTFAAFAFLPFAAVRFAMFTAIVAAPIAARNLGEALTALPDRTGPIRLRTAAAIALALLALASVPLGRLAPHIRFGAGLTRGVFPVRGADYLEALGGTGRLFNTFHFGGYLSWREVGPPFQDGRGGLRPEDAAAALAGPMHRALFADLDGRYRFDALLVSYPEADPVSNPLAPIGIFDPDRSTWALVAFDDAALLYLRRSGAFADAAARDEFRHVFPARPVLALPVPDPASALEELRRAVREAPDCFRCRYFLGELALHSGRPEEAAAAVAPAIPRAFGAERRVLSSVAERAARAREP